MNDCEGGTSAQRTDPDPEDEGYASGSVGVAIAIGIAIDDHRPIGSMAVTSLLVRLRV